MFRPESTLMYLETAETAAAIERQLKVNADILATLGSQLRARPPRFILTCARGSSDHAATYAKYVFETQLGLVTASASPGIASIYGTTLKLKHALFIAISQSGKSPDLLRTTELAREAGAYILVIVNVPDSPLAALADTLIPLHAGTERSVAATKSYLATLAAILQLVAYWREDHALHAAMTHLPEALYTTGMDAWQPLVQALSTAQHLFVVGRGPALGAAQEAALKLKETCGLHAEAFSAAEVQHGPMALVKKHFPLLFLMQPDASMSNTLAVANALRDRGARVFVAAPGNGDADHLPLPTDFPPLLTPLLAMHRFYYAANALALVRGYNPDLPPHLNKITETM